MKAIKEVETAMKNASKKGVHFWDNYGSLTAFNNNEIHLPVPFECGDSIPLNTHHTYSLNINNFHAGNADDQLYVKFR